MFGLRYVSIAALALGLTACNGDAVVEPAETVKPVVTVSEAAPLMSWGELTARPLPQPTRTVSFGDLPTNIADVWLPDGEGPHPVVLMIHGGCWQKAIADRTLMNYAAEALRNDGMAVWNIEYRGVDEEGGGYPGTYLDVAKAAHAIKDSAADLNLDTSRIAGIGHSAGGHLITWLAGIKNLPAGSELVGAGPLDMKGVINSGGLADLKISGPLTLKSCLADIQDILIGPSTTSRPDPYADTSSDRLLPTGIEVYSVNGARDRIAPSLLGEAFTIQAKTAGDTAEAYVIANEGHVELIAPGTAAFDKQTELLKSLLGINEKD